MEADDVMVPRSFGATFASIALTSGPPFGAVMGAFSTLFDVVLGRLSVTRTAVNTLGGAVAFGLLFGLAMAPLLRGVSRSISVRDPATFAERLAAALRRVGYNHHATTGDLSRFDPGWKAGALAGRMYVRLEGEHAHVVGARMHVRKLERLLQRPDGSVGSGAAQEARRLPSRGR
jgi:hypothetical protein